MLGLLLKNKLKITISGFIRGTGKSRSGRYTGLILGFALFSMITYFSIRFNLYISRILAVETVNLVYDKILDFSLGIVFVLILFSGIATSLFVLYLSKDLDLLISFPIRQETVFSYKFIEAVIANSHIVFIVVFPFLIGYGINSSLPFLYYPLIIVILVCIISIPTGFGILLGMVTARFVNPGKAREILAVMGGMMGIAFFLVSQLIGRYLERSGPVLDTMKADNAVRYIISQFDRSFINYLPSTWGANAIYHFHNGELALSGLNFIYILALSFILVFACLVLSRKIYYTGWSGTRHFSSGRRAKRYHAGLNKTAAGSSQGAMAKRTTIRLNYMLVKDFKIFFRDIRQLLNVLIPMFVFGFLFFFSYQDSIGSNMSGFFMESRQLIFLILPMFLTGIIIMNISGNSIGGEGLHFWLMKAMPVAPRKLVRSKMLFGFIAGAAGGTLIMLIMYFFYRPDLEFLVFGFLMIILFSWGESVVGTTMGVFFPEFKPAYRKRSNITFTGGILSLVFFVVYLAVSGGVTLGLLFLNTLSSWPAAVFMAFALILQLVINIILYHIMINISAYRINSLEWRY